MKKHNVILTSVLSMALLLSQWSGVLATTTNTTEGFIPESQTASEMLKSKSYAKDQLIVMYEGASNKAIEKSVASNDAEVEEIAKLEAGTKAVQVAISDEDSMKDAIEKFQEDPSVAIVQPNYFYKKQSLNDPYLQNKKASNYEYQLENVRAEEAWAKIGEPKKKTVVAVIDSGVDPQHKDLKENLILNENGEYKQFYQGEENWINDDMDQSDSHGSHCCGIIGAVSNNNIYGAGIASGETNNLVSVLPISVYDEDVEGYYTFDMVKAIRYAVEKEGASVISLSYGFGKARDRVLESEVKDEFYKNNVVFSVAAGNESTDEYSCPASFKETLSILAANRSKKAASFTNYGESTDVAAPGESLFSTIAGDEFMTMSGTSMAAPATAAVIALVRDANPDLTAQQVMNILCATASNHGVFDPTQKGMSYGHVDALDAVTAAQKIAAGDVASPTSIDIQSSTSTLTVGDDVTLRYVVMPETASTDVTWSSDHSEIAKVDEKGQVIAVSAGEAVITATSKVNSSVSQSYTITVKDNKSDNEKSLTIKFARDQNEIALGSALAATATLTGTEDDEVYWTSSDDSIAFVEFYVTEKGVCEATIQAKALGKATITATNRNKDLKESIDIEVKNSPDSIKLTKKTKWVQLGDPGFGFEAACYLDGKKASSEEIANYGIDWKVVGGALASIDKNGVLKAKKAGVVYVEASYGDFMTARTKVIIAKKDYKGKEDYNLKQVGKKSKSKIELSWKKVPIASGYEVQYSKSKNGKFKTVTKISSASKVKTSIKTKKDGYYRVRASYVKNGKTKHFSYSNTVKARVKK